MKRLTYDRIAAFLGRTNALVSATELHGMICGFVCAGARMNGKAWLEVIIGNAGIPKHYYEATKEMLIALYMMTYEQLKSINPNFQMLLPGNTEVLTLRARAVGEWCSGVMLGLSLADICIDDSEEEDIRNAMFHISEFACINYQELSFNEEDEYVYAEVVEYLRTVTVMFYQEFAMPQYKSKNPMFARTGAIRVIH